MCKCSKDTGTICSLLKLNKNEYASYMSFHKEHNRSKNKGIYFNFLLYALFIYWHDTKTMFVIFGASTMTSLVHKLSCFVLFLFFQNEGIIMLSFSPLAVQLLQCCVSVSCIRKCTLYIPLPSWPYLPTTTHHHHHPPSHPSKSSQRTQLISCAF